MLYSLNIIARFFPFVKRETEIFPENSRYRLFLSLIRQGIFYVPFILVLPRLLGALGIYLAQPAADVLTVLVCLRSVGSMKRIASRNMGKE